MVAAVFPLAQARQTYDLAMHGHLPGQSSLAGGTLTATSANQGKRKPQGDQRENSRRLPLTLSALGAKGG
jgi:hypothetical protein